MPTTSAFPIRTLREHVTELEAALTLCLADPGVRPVHRLRTMTRRIEGQLALLDLLAGVPSHDKLARKARRVLKKLRRAAGTVRDIDVQIDLIKEALPEESSRALQKDADTLSEALREDREGFARKLLRTLSKNQSELSLVLEALLDKLKPSEDLALSSTQLASLAQEWFKNNTAPEPKHKEEADDHLHDIRKMAKLARYIAENAPKTARLPRRVAQSFEDLQQSGGHWHDWMVLADLSAEELGSSSPLTKLFARRSKVALSTYRRHLRPLVRESSS